MNLRMSPAGTSNPDLGSVSTRLTSPSITCISNESKSYKKKSVHSKSLYEDEKKRTIDSYHLTLHQEHL